MTEKAILHSEPFVPIHPNMTPEEWAAVFAAVGITQQRIDAFAIALIRAQQAETAEEVA